MLCYWTFEASSYRWVNDSEIAGLMNVLTIKFMASENTVQVYMNFCIWMAWNSITRSLSLAESGLRVSTGVLYAWEENSKCIILFLLSRWSNFQSLETRCPPGVHSSFLTVVIFTHIIPSCGSRYWLFDPQVWTYTHFFIWGVHCNLWTQLSTWKVVYKDCILSAGIYKLRIFSAVFSWGLDWAAEQ